MVDDEKNLAGEEDRTSLNGTPSPISDAGARDVGIARDRSQVKRPAARKYRQLRLGPVGLSWFASPITQLVLVSFVCFLCPGMFNALAGMGGGGQVDATTADNANTTLYSVFAVVGFFAGSITNRLGVKFALSFGGLGYCVYIASFLCYSHTANQGFNIFAGALLGVCAGLLWSAQGAIMMSYPTEKYKGRYISLFWIIFNLGAVIGSLVNRNLFSNFDTLLTMLLDSLGSERSCHRQVDCDRWHLCRIHRLDLLWSGTCVDSDQC